jgi:hypothetical protein
LSLLHAEDFLPEKLKAVTYKEIDSFEQDLLTYFKKLSPKEKQDKYLLEFFSLMDHLQKKENIERYFSKIIRYQRYHLDNHDDVSEVILIYLKNSRILSRTLEEGFLKDAIRKSTSIFRIS